MRTLISAVVFVLVSAVPVFSYEKPKSRVSVGATASSVVVFEARPETRLEKVSAEALDICLRIYRWYGHVEVKAVSVGNGQTVVVCQ